MAVKAPKVQSLSQVMKELNPAYAASTNVIKKQQSAIPAKYDAQRAGINAERGEGFSAINDQATGRGASFSGIPQHEQARYLSTKYLPGMQMADFQQNSESLEFEGRLADIDKEKRLAAQDTIKGQKSDLNSWNMAQVQREFDAKQAKIEREFKAQEAAAQRAFSASQSAAARAASAPKKLSPYESAMAIIGGAAAKGDVSANVFQLARDAYAQSGGDKGKFASDFWKYVPKSANTNGKWRDYYYG